MGLRSCLGQLSGSEGWGDEVHGCLPTGEPDGAVPLWARHEYFSHVERAGDRRPGVSHRRWSRPPARAACRTGERQRHLGTSGTRVLDRGNRRRIHDDLDSTRTPSVGLGNRRYDSSLRAGGTNCHPSRYRVAMTEIESERRLGRRGIARPRWSRDEAPSAAVSAT